MTGMNWFWLVIGVVAGALGQRWLGLRQRRHERFVESAKASAAASQVLAGAEGSKACDATSSPVGQSGGIRGDADGDDRLLWMAYVRALERAQFQGGFLARVAHELRSPLSSLMGLQQLILADLCDDAEEERQCVAQSYEAAQKLHGLMDQLIRVAKLEHGSQQLDLQNIALDLLLEDVESFVQLQVADRNARLQLQLPSQPVYAKADYNSLRQILVMLVEVALVQKASEIRIALMPADGGSKLNFWADQPLVPTEELESQLAGNDGGEVWSRDLLVQLKQSFAQEPGAHFVPHRLSPGMVLLISQLLLDLNGGRLALVGRPDEAAAHTAPEEVGLEAAENSLELKHALELWLPSA